MTSQLQKTGKAEKMQHMSSLQDLLANRLCILLEKEGFNLENLQNSDKKFTFYIQFDTGAFYSLNVKVWEARIICN